MAPQSQAPVESSNDASWLDDDPVSNIEDMFKTSLGIQVSVQPSSVPAETDAEIIEEESLQEQRITPSLTPSGRPMSLQPHEEINFKFSDENEASEGFKLDQLNLGSTLEEDSEPDADESVDRIIEEPKRWSKPPESQNTGKSELIDEAQRLLSQSDRPTASLQRL